MVSQAVIRRVDDLQKLRRHVDVVGNDSCNRVNRCIVGCEHVVESSHRSRGTWKVANFTDHCLQIGVVQTLFEVEDALDRAAQFGCFDWLAQDAVGNASTARHRSVFAFTRKQDAHDTRVLILHERKEL